MAAAAPKPSTLELDPKYDDYDFPTTAPVAQNGHPGFLTPEQQAQVHQLRLLLESEGYTKRLDTLTLVRRKRRTSWGTGMEWLLIDEIVAVPARAQVRCPALQADVS